MYRGYSWQKTGMYLENIGPRSQGSPFRNTCAEDSGWYTLPKQ